MFVQKLEKHQSNQHSTVVFLPKHFSASFGWKKAFVFMVVETNSTLTTAHYVSQIWRSFSKKSFVGSNGFLRSCVGKVLFESCANVWWTNFFAGEFLAKLFGNEGFSEGKCHSVTIVWPIILYLASHYQLVDIICIFRSIPLSADVFWFFTKLWPKKNLPRMIFQLFFFAKSLVYENLQVSRPCISHEQKNSCSKIYKTEFWCKFTLWWSFYCLFIAEKCQKAGFISFCKNFQIFIQLFN